MKTSKVPAAVAVLGAVAGPMAGIFPLHAEENGHAAHDRDAHEGESATAVHKQHEQEAHHPGKGWK